MTSRTLHSPSADPRDDIPYAIKSQITKIAYSDPNFTTSIIKRATDFALASAFHAAIQNTPLESFTISNSKIGEDASLQLRECLSTNVDLAILHISSSVITPTRFRRIVQGLGKNAFDSNLTELTFTDCALTERCGQLLSEHLCSPPPEAPLCKNLAILDLSNNQLSDRGAIGVSYLLHPPESRLVRLSLSKNRISSDGAAAIAAALTDNKFLHSLDFSYNLISANGGIALATLLSRNKYISSLLLAHNRIGSAAALKFYEVLSHEDFKSMSTLDISNNNIGDAGGAAMQKLADEKKNVGTLIICGNKIGLCDCKLCVLSKTSDSSHWSYNVGVEENVFVEIDENGGLVTTVNAGVDDGVDWEALEEEERKKEWAAIAPKIEVENKKLAAILAHEEEVHRKRQEEIEFEKGRAEREFKAAEAEKKRLKEVEERKKGLNKKVGLIQATMYNEDEESTPIGVEADEIDNIYAMMKGEKRERELRLKKEAEERRLEAKKKKEAEEEGEELNRGVVVVKEEESVEVKAAKKEAKLKLLAEKPVAKRISIKEMIAMSEKATITSVNIRDHNLK